MTILIGNEICMKLYVENIISIKTYMLINNITIIYQHNITMEVNKSCQICSRPFYFVNQKINKLYMKAVEHLCVHMQGHYEIRFNKHFFI